MKTRLGILLGVTALFGTAPAMAGNWGFGFGFDAGPRYFAPRYAAPIYGGPVWNGGWNGGWCGTGPVFYDTYVPPVVRPYPYRPFRRGFYNRGYVGPRYRSAIRARSGFGRIYRNGAYFRGRGLRW